jgi:hypothetical protein
VAGNRRLGEEGAGGGWREGAPGVGFGAGVGGGGIKYLPLEIMRWWG